MMKKNGFTLAEVLITLAIIGVVATLTLPALMTNTGEQQAQTAVKKAINTLTEAAQMNSSVAGFDYSSLSDASSNNNHDPNSQSLYGILFNRAALDQAKTRFSGNADLHQTTGNYVVYFRDGSSFEFNPAHNMSNPTTASVQQADGLPYGIIGVFDMNGDKAPNLYSNCAANQARTTLPTDATAQGTLEACYDKANRAVKDKFQIRLRGSIAVPHDPVTRWAAGEEVVRNAQETEGGEQQNG